MRTIILLCIGIAFVWPSRAEDTEYQSSLRKARERLEVLEMQRNDYRRIKPGGLRPQLLPAEEAERDRLLGQLLNDDPIWGLTRRLEVDLDALTIFRREVPAGNSMAVEDLKELLVLTNRFEGQATTHAEAEKIATALRQFIILRDVAGAKTWARNYSPR